MKTLFCALLFIATMSYSQIKDIEMPNWKLQVQQMSPNKIYIQQDLFELTASKSNEKLSSVELRLFDGKVKMGANPDDPKNPSDLAVQVAAWPVSKFTTYYDLNGDTEIDYFVKSGHHRKPGSTDPNELEEFIIYENRIIRIQPTPYYGIGKEVTDVDGHQYTITPKGWLLVK